MFVSFEARDTTWGYRMGRGVVSGHRLAGGRYRDLRSVLVDGLQDRIADEAEARDPDLDSCALRYLPVVPNAEHVFCAGINYSDHATETGKESPEEPRIFLRANSSLVGHRAPLRFPAVSTQFDFEGEVAVVIGREGHLIDEAKAMSHVAGYACFMDGSVRDWQKSTTTMGKNFVGTGAFGPGLVLASRIPDWSALSLSTRVNGTEVQRTTLDRMIHPIPRLVSYLSRMTPLRPGDVIVTGTPEGIGCRRDPPLWLKHGDAVEVEVPGVGCLANVVA
jgi:2-keto-4-pentenoate hydratase/2-oxohepta-3-ene-1,7-dioic acid hydratase in catechol pathway